MKNVAFLGMGSMGSRMAKSILAAGFPLTVYNRSPQKTQELAALGAIVAPTAAEAVKGQDVVVAMVTNDEASRSIWLDAKLQSQLSKTAVCIDCSTLSYQCTLDIARELAKAGHKFLEAPVVGTLPQAEQKQLLAIIAGDRKVFDEVEDVFKAFTGRQMYLPKPGQGAALKLVNNGLFGIQTAAYAEAYATLGKLGFEESEVHGILSQLPITSVGMQAMLGLIHERRFAPLFPIELAEKDFGYAETLMRSVALEPYLVGATRRTLKVAMDKGYGQQNISAVAQLYGVKEKK